MNQTIKTKMVEEITAKYPHIKAEWASKSIDRWASYKTNDEIEMMLSAGKLTHSFCRDQRY